MPFRVSAGNLLQTFNVASLLKEDGTMMPSSVPAGRIPHAFKLASLLKENGK